MKHFSKMVDGKKVNIFHVNMIDNITKEIDNVVLITDADDSEDISAESLFEVKFSNPTQAEMFHTLLQKAEITQLG